MHPPGRYAQLLSLSLQESPAPLIPRPFSEMELQAHWFAGDFGRDFLTVTGQPVRIIQFGVWNHEAGPDFADAAVSINHGPPIRGSIELDPDARDWERHGHAENPAYENVVLHLFPQSTGAEFFTRTTTHRNVPQVHLNLLHLPPLPPPSLPPAILGHCSAPLVTLSETQSRDVLIAAAHFRLQKKAATLATLTELHGPDEALFQSLATTLGYKNNKLPFTLLAQRLPLRILRKSHPTSLLFGTSGFLPNQDLGPFDHPTRSYLRKLWDLWWPERAEFARFSIPPKLWNLSGQRPSNHPQRRLAALAAIVRHWPKIRALRDLSLPSEIFPFFSSLTDPFWNHHYTIHSKPTPKPMALIGTSRITDILANVFFPLAITTDEKRWISFLKLRAPVASQRAKIAAFRLFGNSPRAREFLKFAALQQGLLQVYEDFCLRDLSDCSTCLFPRQISQW